MAKKDKKKFFDPSIPIRVTHAKNTASRQTMTARLQDQTEPRKQLRDGRQQTSDLESLLNFGGKKIDMSRMDQGNRRRRLFIRITIIVVLLFGLAFAGFWVFSQTNKKFGQNIAFTINAPDVAASGEVITLLVEYENNESINLDDTELVMQFPDGFRFQSSSPSNVSPNTWSIGELKAGSGGVVSIKGQVVGNVDSTITFSGTLSYVPSNFNYAFEEETTSSIRINASVLSLKIDAPLRIPPDKSFETTITYTNTSSETLESVRLQLAPPSAYTLTNADPADEEKTWTIDKLEPDESKKITLTGTLSGEIGTQQQFSVRIGFVDEQENFNLQSESTYLILLIKSGLTLAVGTNYSQDTDFAEWGDTITYAVSYTNDGEDPQNNVRIELQLRSETSGGSEASLIHWDGITSPDKGKVSDTSIVWSPNDVPALGEVKPGDTGSFTVIVPLLSAPSDDQENQKDFQILSTVKAYLGDQTDPISTSDVSATKIATQVSLESEGRYYSDTLEVLGDGPIPPEVEATTEYRIFLRIENISNDIENVTVSAVLPSGVSWVGEPTISAGDPMKYNTQTRTVTWTINRIPAGAGSSFAALEASFSVSITPTTSQVGSIVTLMQSANISATDTFTKANRDDASNPVTTDLPNDPQAKNQGSVVASS